MLLDARLEGKLDPSVSGLKLIYQRFQSICESVLYQHITTDNFCSLILNCPLRTKGRFLHLTKSLRIEHSSFGREQSYLRLLKTARWDLQGMTIEESKASSLIGCRAELKNTGIILRKFLMPLGADKIFPQLETLALHSIYGRVDDCWPKFEGNFSLDQAQESLAQSQDLLFCRRELDTFFKTSSTLKHFCCRDVSGPLTFDKMSYPTNDRLLSRTVHFTTNGDRVAATMGKKTRWVSDMPSDTDLADLLNGIGRCAQQYQVLGRDSDSWLLIKANLYPPIQPISTFTHLPLSMVLPFTIVL